jgi:DNA-binding NtrC family response regulator
MKKRILIIDDERDFGLLLKGFFTRKKYEVQLAYTIAEGMKALEEMRPDYIFLDNNLPDGLGWSKADYILNKYPHTQLNLITAFNAPKTSLRAHKILEKPLNVDELNTILE